LNVPLLLLQTPLPKQLHVTFIWSFTQWTFCEGNRQYPKWSLTSGYSKCVFGTSFEWTKNSVKYKSGVWNLVCSRRIQPEMPGTSTKMVRIHSIVEIFQLLTKYELLYEQNNQIIDQLV
jgi:hypothetical protein